MSMMMSIVPPARTRRSSTSRSLAPFTMQSALSAIAAPIITPSSDTPSSGLRQICAGEAAGATLSTSGNIG